MQRATGPVPASPTDSDGVAGTHREFKLLSMTELRTRPGEILDRVADDGEAYIIEKNGHRKACLVPVSVFFPDISTTRLADELAELTGKEEPRLSINGKRELVLRFAARSSDASAIDLDIVLPHGYPNRCPRVYAPTLTDKVPHRWADGALCIYGVMSAWNPGKHTISSTLALARLWRDNYAVWQQTGKWPSDGGPDEPG